MTPDRKRQQKQKHGVPVVAAAYVDKAIQKTLHRRLFAQQPPPMGTVNSDPRSRPFLFGGIMSRDHLIPTETREVKIGGDLCNWPHIQSVYVHGYEYVCFQRPHSSYRYVAIRLDKRLPIGSMLNRVPVDKTFFVSDKRKINCIPYYWPSMQELQDAIAQDLVFIC